VVRALQSLGRPVPEVGAVARVAVNLRGVDRVDVRRGDALLTPGRFWVSDTVDVRVHGDAVRSLPRKTQGVPAAREATPRLLPRLGAVRDC
jgi:selenocysteine-specific elongation factor